MSTDTLGGALSGLDLASLLTQQDVQTEESALEAVSRDIARDLVEVVALSGSQLLSGRDEGRVLEQLADGLGSLMRLARASQDPEHIALLEGLDEALVSYRGKRGKSGPRHAFLNTLRDWLPRYGSYLGGDSEERLTALVEFNSDELPLFAELANIRGIGPRRLRRLHGAGFYQAASLSHADPEELAAVTGLPRKLAADVIAESAAWQEEQRRRAVVDMNRRLQDFQRAVSALKQEGNGELLSAAQEAMNSMRAMLADLEG